MESNQNYVADLERLFHASKDVLITTRANPRVDGLCAMLALGKAFGTMPLTTLSAPGQTRKTVSAVSGRQGSQFSSLPGSEHIVSELGLRDFVIGLPGYVDKGVESVSWYVDQGRLHVVLKSNPAVPMQFDPKLFDPFYAGSNFDVVCVIDVDNPADLGALYRQDPGMFTELPVVNISTTPGNTRFGRINVVEQQVSSVSELMYELLAALHINLDYETAALLLCGIEDGSEFMQKATPRTIEVVQELKKIVHTPFDTHAVRGQINNQPLPVHPQGVQPLPNQVPPQGYNMPPAYGQQYPPQAVAPYPQYQPPMPPQFQGYPPIGYPGYPPQGGYAQPQNVQAPPQYPGANNPQQQSFPSYHAPNQPYQQPQSQNFYEPQSQQVQQPTQGYGAQVPADYGKKDGAGSLS